MAERLPHEGFQKLRSIVMTMHQRSCEIYTQKRQALERGDEGSKQQLSEGKDIMSILRAFHYFMHDANHSFKEHPILSQGEHGCLQRGETAGR